MTKGEWLQSVIKKVAREIYASEAEVYGAIRDHCILRAFYYDIRQVVQDVALGRVSKEHGDRRLTIINAKWDASTGLRVPTNA